MYFNVPPASVETPIYLHSAYTLPVILSDYLCMPKELTDPVYCIVCEEVHSRTTAQRHLRNGGPSRARIAQQHNHLRKHRVHLQRQQQDLSPPRSSPPLPSFKAEFTSSQQPGASESAMDVDGTYYILLQVLAHVQLLTNVIVPGFSQQSTSASPSDRTSPSPMPIIDNPISHHDQSPFPDESDDSSSEESGDELGGYESSDEEDFRTYDHNTPSWQQGLSAMDQLAEEFDVASVLRGTIYSLLFKYNMNLIY